MDGESSPIRLRVNKPYWTREATAFRAWLQRNMVRYDASPQNPAVSQPRQHGAHSYLLVGGPTPKYRWTDVSASSEVRLQQFLDHYDAARAAGGFVPVAADRNPVLTSHEEMSFYKNRAAELLAADLSANYPGAGNHTADDLVQRGFVARIGVW